MYGYMSKPKTARNIQIPEEVLNNKTSSRKSESGDRHSDEGGENAY